MKRYAYVTRTGEGCQLVGFEDRQPVTEPAGPWRRS